MTKTKIVLLNNKNNFSTKLLLYPFVEWLYLSIEKKEYDTNFENY